MVKAAIFKISEETYCHSFSKQKFSLFTQPKLLALNLKDRRWKWMKPEVRMGRQVAELILMEKFL